MSSRVPVVGASGGGPVTGRMSVGTAVAPPGAGAVAGSDPRPLSPWRLEWLRLVRSPRGLTLLVVYLFFGLVGPVMAKYVREILKLADSTVTITAPEPRPVDGIVQYLSQSGQTGLLVVVVIAAGALAFDSRRGVSTFLRTRTTRVRDLVIPRYAVSTLAAVAAYTLGTIAAWYETVVLLGPLPVDRMLQGWLCGSVYLGFAVAVVAAAASVARSVPATVGLALGALLLLPLLGIATVVHPYAPSSLMNAPVELLGTATLGDFGRTLAVTVAASAALLYVAGRRLAAREI